MRALLHVRGVHVPLIVDETLDQVLALVDEPIDSGVPSDAFIELHQTISTSAGPKVRELRVDRFAIAAVGETE